LSLAERQSVKRIAVTGKSISDLTGIEHFPNLEQLFCAQNSLQKIDVSKNTKLQALNVSLNSKLGAIDVSANIELYWFACAKTGIQTLNVRSNTALTYLSCGDNDLTSLDLSQNRSLEELYIESNPIETIDLSNNPKLKRFTFASTALTSLDLSNQSGDIMISDLHRWQHSFVLISFRFSFSICPQPCRAEGWAASRFPRD
jgi:Leucine-rich repeat (LRR) protein